MTLPGSGLRVLDFAQWYGSIPAMMLADFGAEVIKVEPPEGDPTRSMPAFLQWNRGKKGVVLDLKTDDGRKKAQGLAASCDIVIENFQPGVAKRLGIDYETLSAANPGLVYLSISGFGQQGKYRDYKGYEGIVGAKTGQHVIQNGYRDDGPIYDAVFKDSYGASILGLIGILSAIYLRDKTGIGQKVESTLVQANFVYSYSGIRAQDVANAHLVRANVQGRDPHNTSAGYRIAQCADGQWIQSGSAGAGIFDNLMKALDIKEYFTEEQLKGGQARWSPEDRDRMLRRMDETYRSKPLDEWVRILKENDAAYGTFMTTQEFMDYPQVVHNGHVVDVVDPTVGPMKQVGPIARFLDEEWEWPGPAPRLGEHTGQVLNAALPAKPAPSTPNVQVPEGALNGVTILDLSMWAAAPGGPGILGDLGARVIKVEPLSGDPMGAGQAGGELFYRVNRSKERLGLDLKAPEGREAFHKLVAKSDVVIHNFRPGVPTRLGVDFETLSAVNPRLVYLYAASFGSSGPDASRPAFDAVISAMAGGEVLQSGEGNPPQQRQTTDHSALLGVAVAILLGLRAREITGKAQNVETTMLASAAYLFSDDFLRYEGKPERAIPDKGQYGLHALYRLYRAKDGSWVFLAALTDEEWAALCEAIGHSDWRDDPRFRTAADRKSNSTSLASLLEPLFAERHADEWEQLLMPKGAPCARADGTWTDFLFNEGHAGQDQFIQGFEAPGVGGVDMAGMTVNLLKTPGKLGSPSVQGQETVPILEELGYSADQIEDMKARGVIYCAPGVVAAAR